MKSDLFAILAVLAEKAGSGVEILERLEAAGAEAPTVPTLYRRVREALEAGWIVLEGVEGEGPGRPGRRYALTPGGRAAAREAADRWRGVVALVLGEKGQ